MEVDPPSLLAWRPPAKVPLVTPLTAPSGYKDRAFPGSLEEYRATLATSTTVYVGNLSFYTTEEQVHALFRFCGEVKRVIMGLNKEAKTPCGFCFVEYYEPAAALAAVRVINGTKLDDRPVRADMDWGFKEGRQYGRARSGGQVRDEFREDFDPGRGGWGGRAEAIRGVYEDYYQGGEMAPMGAPSFGKSYGGGFSYAGTKKRRDRDPDFITIDADGGEGERRTNPRFRKEREDEE